MVRQDPWRSGDGTSRYTILAIVTPYDAYIHLFFPPRRSSLLQRSFPKLRQRWFHDFLSSSTSTMSYSSDRTASPQQARFSTSSLEVDEEINKNLFPIQVSATNSPTAVHLYSTIEELIQVVRSRLG